MNPIHDHLNDQIRQNASAAIEDMGRTAAAFKGDKEPLLEKIKAVKELYIISDRLLLQSLEDSNKAKYWEVKYRKLEREYLELRRDFANLREASEAGAPKMTEEQYQRMIKDLRQ